MRTITSGRVMLVSTKFRSDLFYRVEKPENEAILKLWAFHTNTDLAKFDSSDILISAGDEVALSEYFHAINNLSTNWYKFRLYQKAFNYSFSNDHQNPVAKTVVGCDQHIIQHPNIKRAALFNGKHSAIPEITKDTFSMAMRIINNETYSN